VTHTELTNRAIRWLRGRQQCRYVSSEVQCTISGEIPDAIGWNRQAQSVLIECKTSKSDLVAGFKKKHFRQAWRDYIGLGRQRYILAEKGKFIEADIPENWGWLEASKGQIKVRRVSSIFEYNFLGEISLLAALLDSASDSTLYQNIVEVTDGMTQVIDILSSPKTRFYDVLPQIQDWKQRLRYTHRLLKGSTNEVEPQNSFDFE